MPGRSARLPLARRAVDAVELMDGPDCDPEALRRTYARFPWVNRGLAGWGRIYADLLRPALPRDGTATLLDIGCGGGDVALDLARRAARDGIRLRIVGIDPDERARSFAVAAARRAGVGPERVEFRAATSADLVAEGLAFDAVVSNHVLHHLDGAALAGLLADTERLARGIAVHNDIRRSPAAWLLFSVAALPLAPGSFILHDGLVSIRRSYTTAEIAAEAPVGWAAERRRPFRNLLVWRAGHPGAPRTPRTPRGPA